MHEKLGPLLEERAISGFGGDLHHPLAAVERQRCGIDIAHPGEFRPGVLRGVGRAADQHLQPCHLDRQSVAVGEGKVDAPVLVAWLKLPAQRLLRGLAVVEALARDIGVLHFETGEGGHRLPGKGHVDGDDHREGADRDRQDMPSRQFAHLSSPSR